MDILDSLLQLINDKYANGMTDEEIACEFGCSHQQINHLRNGKRSFGNMKLETLIRMFPNLRVSLDGSPITATNSAVNAGVNNGSMTIHAAGEEDKIKSSLRSAILKSDGICDSCKVKILTLLETV